MKTVKFQFDIDDEVITNFCKKGIIDTCGLDSSGIIYCVKTSDNLSWYKEKFLEKAKKC